MTTTNVLIVASIFFFIGLSGVILRRNILIMLMSIELMLNAANLTFVAFSRELEQLTGQMSVFFVITVAAAESAVGLGLVIALYRNMKSVNTNALHTLKE